MFICGPCLEKNYTNWSAFKSYGNCEECGNSRSCHDIPIRNLNRKTYFRYRDDGTAIEISEQEQRREIIKNLF